MIINNISFIDLNCKFNLILDTQVEMSRNNGPGLYEFLMEAELQQYYPGIRGNFIYFSHILLYFF